MATEDDGVKLDPHEHPFVLVVGGSAGAGFLGSDENDTKVDVVVNEILYVPWNQEHTAPRRMILVYASETATELAQALNDAAALVKPASEQALEVLTTAPEA